MTSRPRGWVVQHHQRWYGAALRGGGALVVLMFSLLCLGAFAFFVAGAVDGTLLRVAERSIGVIGVQTPIALLALAVGGLSLRWACGSLIDLFVAERVVCGPIEALAVDRGLRGRRFIATVAGETVVVPADVFATLTEGDRVWMRAGRFQRALKALARPDRVALPPLPRRPGETPAAAPRPPHAAAHRPIADQALRRSDVPLASAPWTELERFALSWPGDAGPEQVALHQRHAQAGTLPDDLAELRVLLFIEQRRHRHALRPPWGAERERVHAMVEAIRARVPPDA